MCKACFAQSGVQAVAADGTADGRAHGVVGGNVTGLCHELANDVAQLRIGVGWGSRHEGLVGRLLVGQRISAAAPRPTPRERLSTCSEGRETREADAGLL